MVEGDRCDRRHGCGGRAREGWGVGIRRVIHRHHAMHWVCPDCVLNLSVSVNRIPTVCMRWGRKGEGEDRV